MTPRKTTNGNTTHKKKRTTTGKLEKNLYTKKRSI